MTSEEMQFVINTIVLELERQSAQGDHAGEFLYESPCSLASQILHHDQWKFGDEVDWVEVAMNVAERYPAWFAHQTC